MADVHNPPHPAENIERGDAGAVLREPRRGRCHDQRRRCGNYSSALVALDADPATAGDYQATLAKIVNDPQGKVPPGIYAEYGYVLQQQGNTRGAIAMYAREKAAWPESALFMDQMIAALQAPAQPKPVS
jgi:hypothetical protein